MATKWVSEIDGSEFKTKEQAIESAQEQVHWIDIAARVGYNVSCEAIIRELQRLESPLFYTLLEEATNELFHDYFYEERIEEEKE